MNLEIDTVIRYPDGQEAGTISGLITSPSTREVESVVMSAGLTGRQVVVPTTMLSEAPGDVLQIDAEPEEVDRLPAYTTDAQYVLPTDAEGNPDASAMENQMFPMSEIPPILPVVEFHDTGEAELALVEGAEVWCDDGRVGVVRSVEIDEQGTVGGFIMRQDTPGAPDLLVPLELVGQAGEAEVYLNCTAASLGDYVTPLSPAEEPVPGETEPPGLL